MEARAHLRGLRMSPRKVRMVANMIRGKTAADAIDLLTLSTKRASRAVKKLVNSAVANADDKKANVDDLMVKAITVDGGPIIKRWMPRAQGRANRINHRTSHITVVLTDGQD